MNTFTPHRRSCGIAFVRPEPRLRVHCTKPSQGEQYVGLRNAVKGVGGNDAQADLAVSKFAPTFVIEDSLDKRFGQVDKRFEQMEQSLKTQLNALLYKLLAGAAFIALAAVTSQTWLPILPPFFK